MQGDKPFPPPPPARLTGCVLCPPRSRETMTTDEATKSEGEVQAAALAERGEDITPSKDRGVLKVRGICSVLPSCTLGCRSPQPSGSQLQGSRVEFFHFQGKEDEHCLEEGRMEWWLRLVGPGCSP